MSEMLMKDVVLVERRSEEINRLSGWAFIKALVDSDLFMLARQKENRGAEISTIIATNKVPIKKIFLGGPLRLWEGQEKKGTSWCKEEKSKRATKGKKRLITF